MNARQEAKLNMYRATQKHCTDNASVVATVPAFKNAVEAFSQKISTILLLAQQQDRVTKGIRLDKTEARKALCRSTAETAGLVYALASATADHKLKQEVNFSYTALFRTKDELLVPRCANILQLATARLVGLADYGLTTADIADLQTAMDTYHAKVPTTRNAAAAKIATGVSLRALFREADTLLKEQLDKTVSRFRATHAAFAAGYKANRRIVDPASSVTTVKGLILQSGTNTPLEGASVQISGISSTAASGKGGGFKIKPAKLGTHKLLVTAPHFKDKTIPGISIKQGQTTSLHIEMELQE